MSKLTIIQLHLEELFVILAKWRTMEHFMSKETKNDDSIKSVLESVRVIENDIFINQPWLQDPYKDMIKHMIGPGA